MHFKNIIPALLLLICMNLNGQENEIIEQLDKKTSQYSAIAHNIWEWAEMGYLEEKSSALLQKTLDKEGFTINKGVADIPTAFIAEYGEGNPVIAILGEYDALPGLSQQAVAEKKTAGGEAGHACGHHLFGTASTAAVIEAKNWLKSTGAQGTIRFYGCPAEEGGSGKVYMVREGLFDDVDVVLHWHPSAQNGASAGAALANKSGKFRFYGISAHAAGSPEKGRSALDGVEAMNMMVNMMREHIPERSRIHYVITEGGKAPNVVPNFAEVYYYARHNSREVVMDIFDRIIKAAEGAAMGTGTTVEYEIIGGTHELLPNLTLQRIMYDKLQQVGGIQYDQVEKEFADKIAKTLGYESVDMGQANNITPYKTVGRAYGSTDVGDVSFVVPTIGLNTATWVPGTPAHSWQAVAAGGTSIGHKGMMVAAKTLALTAVHLYSNTDLIREAKVEFNERRGADFQYAPLLGDRAPALDYRK